MVSLVAIVIWRRPFILVLAGFLVFGSLDGLYLSSALTKVPDGAWFTLALAIVLSSIFILWRFGKENQWRAESSDRINPSRILTAHGDTSATVDQNKIEPLHPGRLRLTALFGGAEISPIRGMGIFFDKTGSTNSTPTVFVHFLQKFQAAPAVIVFFHIRPLSSPTVPLNERITVSRPFPREETPSPLENFFRVTLRHGYTDEAITSDLGLLLYEELRNFVIREQNALQPNVTEKQIDPDSTSSQQTSSEPQSAPHPPLLPQENQTTPQQNHVRSRLQLLEAAYNDQLVYIVGKEQMRIREDGGLRGWTRRIVLAAFLWLRGNTGTKAANWNLDAAKLVEIGFVKVI